MIVEPPVIGRPVVARLVFLDNPKDIHQPAVAAHDWVTQQNFNLAVAAFLGQRNDPAHPREQVAATPDQSI